jgi:hypothetical protein
MSELVHRLAEKAGIAKEGFTEKMESIGGRGYVANLAELSEFARLVGQVARADERRKYERPDDTPSTDDGG